jgi:hypothetical protein
MSLASGWWDEVMWPALWMSARLGFERVLTDGGYGGMQGVDYAPMLDGRTEPAVPCQPLWWRYFRTLHHLGIRQIGECTGGWLGANVSVGGETDAHHVWMFQGGSIVYASRFLKTAADLHRAYQLYNSCWSDLPADAVRRYAVNFYRTHQPPEWIEFKDLRPGEPAEAVVTSGLNGGMSQPATPENPYKYVARPWSWGDVIWHYADGTEAVYPAHDRIDWARE